MSRLSGVRFALLLLTATLVVTGYWLLFSAFMPYDDEGYVLQTLRDFSVHGHLYNVVYTQYGPAFYLLYDLLHRLIGFDFTNTAGRGITLFNWVVTVGACAGLTWRLTRSGPATCLVLGATFYHLWSMICEPGHPGSLLVLLISVSAWTGVELIRREKIAGFAVLAGITGAVLALIKINVGVFYIAAAGVWLLVNFRPAAAARAGAALGGVALALLPPLLMNHFIGEPWARLFAIVAGIAGATMVMAAWNARRPAAGLPDVLRFLAAGLAVTVVVSALIVARGTSLPALLEGVLLGPMRHPGVYHFAPNWRPGVLPVALFALLAAGLCWRGRHLPWLPAVLAAARLLLATLFFLSYLEILPISTLAFVLDFGLPLACLLVFPLEPGQGGSTASARAWLGLVLTEQALHAYPIAGSQISWGTFLFIPLLAIASTEAVTYLSKGRRPWVASLRFAGGGLVCAGTLFMTGSLVRLGLTRYRGSEPLDLPGAENLRLPENLASGLRVLSQNAVAHGDMLFSLPGVYSFNQWTGLPPPSMANVTHWFSLLNAAQQTEIAATLDHDPRPVIIVERGVLDFLKQGDIPVTGTLFDYIQTHFTRVFGVEEYEFWVRRGRPFAPVSRAEFLQSRDAPGEPTHWRINATVFTGEPVVSAELVGLDASAPLIAHLSAGNARLSATPVRLDGSTTGTTTNDAWGRPLPPLALLTMDLAEALPAFKESSTVLYFLDRQGHRVAEARFMD